MLSTCGAGTVPPALFTKMSSRPWVATTSATKASIELAVALIADPLRGARCPVRFDAGNGVQRRARAADDRGARAQQFVGDTDADAAAGSGDDRDLAVENTHLSTFPPVVDSHCHKVIPCHPSPRRVKANSEVIDE